MADAIVSALVSTILGNLNSVVLREFEIASNLKTELENLKSTLTTVQAVLQDAERKQWKSEAVKNWLRKLKDVAYDADDILDEFAAKALRWKAQQNMGSRSCSRVSDFFSTQNSAIFKFKEAHKIKQIRERLDAVAEEKNKFHLTATVGDFDDSSEWRKTSSLVKESEIFGRHADKENVVDMLVTSLKDESDLSIHAICGMGGLGKTTLAQLVYNDPRVEKAFDLRIWVCVSDDFEVIRLTKAILESIDGSPSDLQELDPLQQRLQEKLRGKRFLLVLDDVWSESYEKWESLKNPLMCGSKGSMVIVTTRIEKVALIMATLPIYHLGYLSEENSWLLFKQRAFLKKSKEEFVKLERIGKQIVKKCGGVPLAVKALGSMLRLKDRESDWLAIQESEIWELPDDGSTILPALRLSYDNLPSHLRQCFAYCSIFPKDGKMNKSHLIELWMANGFVPPRAQRELYEIADEIFYELSWRSFFQNVTEDYDGTVTCKMHDLIHDLAISIMKFEGYLFDNKTLLEPPTKIRHLHIRSSYRHLKEKDQTEKEDDLVRSGLSLRSLILGGLYLREDHCSSLKQLRALDSHMALLPKSLGKMIHLRYFNSHIDSSIRKVPKSISNLVHLTYLNLSYSSIKRLPESITCLQKLQIMKLAYCRCLRVLPEGMKCMRNLKCVDLSDCDSLERTPPEISYLTKLLEFSIFIVRKNQGCGIGELKELNLGKELSIKELNNVEGSTEAKEANLMKKENLRSLRLIWGKHAGEFPDNEEEVLGSLKPHNSLQHLEICSFQGLTLSAWMVELHNLVSLELNQCNKCSCLPPLGKLRLLKFLKIRGMAAVKCIGSEFYGDGVNPFPSLEKLKFDLMPNLETWKSVGRREVFPRLERLTFLKCPKLLELPKFPTLKKLHILTRDDENHFFSNRDDALGSLQIRNSILTVVPNGLLLNQTHIETIRIESLANLKSFPVNGLHGLTSLHTLSITRCEGFASLSAGVMHMKQLRKLCLIGCPMLNSLPKEIQHLNALRSIKISSCYGLTSLPNQIGHLTSLNYLGIEFCPKLMSLPQGMQSLTSLDRLLINGCPQLEMRCNKDEGEDWRKIAHIPSILVFPIPEYLHRERSHGNLFTRFSRKFLKSQTHS